MLDLDNWLDSHSWLPDFVVVDSEKDRLMDSPNTMMELDSVGLDNCYSTDDHRSPDLGQRIVYDRY